MEIRQGGPRTPSPPPPTARETLEEVARDVLESGAEITARERFLLLFRRSRQVTPEQAAEHLSAGQHLQIQFPDQSGRLPLLSPEDLEEAAVFQKLRPATPGSARAQILNLSEHGLRFEDNRGRDLGTYAAYNALTDPAHGQRTVLARGPNGTVPLETTERLGEFATFVQGAPQARLEEQGFQFFAPTGEQQPAFLVPQGQVGRNGNAWLEVGDPQTLEQRLASFQTTLKRVDGDLDLGRRLAGAIVSSSRDVMELVGPLQGERRERLARCALQDLVRVVPAARLLQDGLRNLDPKDTQLQRLWLEAAAPGSEGARVALAVMGGAEFAGTAAWEAAASGQTDGLALARQLLQDVKPRAFTHQETLHAALLKGLGQCQAAREAVGHVLRWQPFQSGPALKAILADPSLSEEALARAALGAGEPEAQGRRLTELAARAGASPILSELTRLHTKAKESQTRDLVYQVAATNPSASDGRAMAAMCQGLLEEAGRRPLQWEDRRLVGSWVTEQLGRFPDTAPAAATVQKWQTNDPFEAAAMAVRHASASTPAELDELARSSIQSWDADAQRRYLAEKVAQPGASPATGQLLELHRGLKSPESFHAVYRLACKNLAVNTGQDWARLGRELNGNLVSSANWEDRAKVGGWLLDRLAAAPDTAPAATTVKKWLTSDLLQAAELAMNHASAQTPAQLDELARASIQSWDADAQRRYLAEKVAQPGASPVTSQLLELHRGLKSSDGYHGVYRLACRNPAANTGQDWVRLGQELNGVFATSSNWEDRNRVGKWLLERLAAAPDTAPAATTVKQWLTNDPLQAAQLAMSHASASTTAELDDLARSSILSWDGEAQRRYLAELAAQPGACPVTRQLLELHRGMKSPESFHAVFRLACKNPTANTGQDWVRLGRELSGHFATSSNWEDRAKVGGWLLERLGSAPDTAPATNTVKKWLTNDTFQAAQLAMDHAFAGTAAELDKLARSSIQSWDAEAQRRYLAEKVAQPGASPATNQLLDLHRGLKSSESFHAVFRLACKNPTASTGQDWVRLGRELNGHFATSSNWEDRLKVGGWLLERLAVAPDTAPAATTVKKWLTNDAFQAAQLAMDHASARTPSELDQLARQAIQSWDAEAQRRYLAGVAARPGASPVVQELLDLHKTLKSPEAWQATFRLACANPAVPTGRELAGVLGPLLDGLAAGTGSLRWEERSQVGRWTLERLSMRADTATAAGLVKDWQVQDPLGAARALCEHPEMSSPSELDALALASIGTWDVQAQARHLHQMAARPGIPGWFPELVRAHSALQASEPRAAIWSLAAQGRDLKAVTRSLQSLPMSADDRKVAERLVTSIQAEFEARQLLEGFQQTNQSVRVEENRVTVGGVVIRRRAERPPAPESATP